MIPFYGESSEMALDTGDIVTTSKKSKADYVIYSLMKDTKGKEHAVSAVIDEAKHCKELATPR